MIKIAVCDDSKENLNELNQYITGYFAQKGDIANEVCCFDSAKELVKAMEEVMFDVYFLDVLIPKLNGIEIGRIIRRADQDAVIVYITVSRDFAFEAFGVRAFQYLQKPVNMKELSETLDGIVHLLDKKQSRKICVNTKDGLVNVNVDDIMYVENISRCAVYMLKDGKQVVSVCNRSSFEKSVGLLDKQSGFVQPHKSYFVNMHFIRTFGSKNLLLDDGTEIAISRKRFVDTKKTYLEFLANGGKCE